MDLTLRKTFARQQYSSFEFTNRFHKKSAKSEWTWENNNFTPSDVMVDWSVHTFLFFSKGGSRYTVACSNNRFALERERIK